MKHLLALFFIPITVLAADNQVSIDQIGNYNLITISQDSAGHTANITLGKVSSVDNSIINIDQKDTSNKSVTVEIKSGYNNSIDVLQQGIGNHVASIVNLNGAANNFTINQSGIGNHSFIATAIGGTNSSNTVNATQSGAAGANKTFNLNFNGATGASVTVQQTNPLASDSGTLTIQCMPGSCGSYSYIRQ
jgi:hypothetical protein